MKHLLYLLLVVNLVYFSWNLLQGATTEDAMDGRLQLPPETRRLMTLEELQEQRRQHRPEDGGSTQPASRMARSNQGIPIQASSSPAKNHRTTAISTFARATRPASQPQSRPGA